MHNIHMVHIYKHAICFRKINGQDADADAQSAMVENFGGRELPGTAGNCRELSHSFLVDRQYEDF